MVQGVIKQVETNYMVGSFGDQGGTDERVNLTVDPFDSQVDDNWTVKIEAGHPDDPDDDDDVDTMHEVQWPLGND